FVWRWWRVVGASLTCARPGVANGAAVPPLFDQAKPAVAGFLGRSAAPTW
ncbi:MAG: hypothetical protein QOK39_2245, partial [Acidimicrobiaceae bacterium]|nr:hypothetical protein [Acidimicrobiaceae bacterium]